VEYLVRQARITDVDRLYALCVEMGLRPALAPHWTRSACCASSSTCRTQASWSPRRVVRLRRCSAQPETIDSGRRVRRHGRRADRRLCHNAEKVADALIEEIMTSARRKGCAIVEVMLPENAALRACWTARASIRVSQHLPSGSPGQGTATTNNSVAAELPGSAGVTGQGQRQGPPGHHIKE